MQLSALESNMDDQIDYLNKLTKFTLSVSTLTCQSTTQPHGNSLKEDFLSPGLN